jgi:hypothetical protein
VLENIIIKITIFSDPLDFQRWSEKPSGQGELPPARTAQQFPIGGTAHERLEDAWHHPAAGAGEIPEPTVKSG